MSGESIEATVHRLAQTPGGQILTSLRNAVQRSLKYYIGLFVVGFLIAFPFSSAFITWLIDADRLPTGVDIIVISPVEFLFLQLRIAGTLGVVLVGLVAVSHVAIAGSRHQAVKERIEELELRLPKPGATVVLSVLSSLLLALFGALYAWEGLLPFLLEYLTNDAQRAGLSTEWRLSGYAGFIVNLVLASALGFQAPVLTTIVLRSELVAREQLTASRRIIWFSSFVLGAFLSPPDPLSLFLVALPVILLFELALLYDRITR
ncbi:MAG: twin-arginine translocase subunit TatC [Candidatus Poseidonia sp.]|nr:twin-arginine translocase subunit TatC [Poseidonia sp.]